MKKQTEHILDLIWNGDIDKAIELLNKSNYIVKKEVEIIIGKLI